MSLSEHSERPRVCSRLPSGVLRVSIAFVVWCLSLAIPVMLCRIFARINPCMIMIATCIAGLAAGASLSSRRTPNYWYSVALALVISLFTFCASDWSALNYSFLTKISAFELLCTTPPILVGQAFVSRLRACHVKGRTS